MSTIIKSLLALTVVVFISACNDETASIEVAMKKVNCEEQTKQPAFLLNGSFSNCSEKTNIFWYDNDGAKNEHIKLCALSKSSPLTSGTNWIQYQPKCFAFQ